MDPEALLTFLFQAPPEVRIVELLGSWDNFQRPYRMHNDRRRGPRFWSGCFKFENIIYDGDGSTWTKPRSGGLKQGATYWYYYRLNHDLEAYDEAAPQTTTCPLLPGQRVNVVEMPSEMVEPPARRRSDAVDVLGKLAEPQSTSRLEPGNKYAALAPPPVCKVHGRCVSDLALNGRLEHGPLGTASTLPSPVPMSDQDANNFSLRMTCPSIQVEPEECDVHAESGSQASQRSLSTLFEPLANFSKIFEADLESRNNYHLAPAVSRPITRHGEMLGDILDLGLQATSDSARKQSYAVDEKERARSPRVSTRAQAQTRDVVGHDMDDGHEQSQCSTSPPFDHQSHQSPFLPSLSPVSGPASDYDSPATDLGAFDQLWSPTFSAQSLSSAGDATPFLLSAHHSRAATACMDEVLVDQHSIARQLESLDISAEAKAEPSDGHPEASPRAAPGSVPSNEPRFAGYTLPRPVIDSGSTMAKLSSPKSNQSYAAYGLSSDPHGTPDAAAQPLPAVFEQEQQGSLADIIFSELGYLGTSIA